MERRIIEGIEACRPGSDDLQSAELGDVARALEQDPQARAAYERVQTWDAGVARAMQQVESPAGLAERILARLQAEQPLNAETTVTAEPSAEVKPAAERPSESWTRRRWLAVAGSLAASVAVAVSLGIWLRNDDQRALEELADTWQQQLGNQWKSIAQAPRDFAVPSAILAEPVSWQAFGNFANGRGVAYKLADNHGNTALLYVVRMTRAGLPPAPPATPQSTTGGKAVGYWQSQGLVYVLVVPGNERSYRGFVSAASVPVA